MAKEEPEDFLPNYATLTDDVLIARPERGVLTPLTLFVCTYAAKLQHRPLELEATTQHLVARGPVVAINSNFGHKAQAGWEHLLKRRPPPPPPRLVPARGRDRKVQGDGTCFNSAIEPIIWLPELGLDGAKAPKVYYGKWFPTTGEVQVPGVVRADRSDGPEVIAALVAYLNRFDFAGVGDVAATDDKALADLAAGIMDVFEERDPHDDEAKAPRETAHAALARARNHAANAAAANPIITLVRAYPKMINYKFRLIRSCPRLLINLHQLGRHLVDLERLKVCENGPQLEDRFRPLFAAWTTFVMPPFPIREAKPPVEDTRVSFRFKIGRRGPRINIFQSGKVNILGAGSAPDAERIYRYLTDLLRENWARLVSIAPRRDAERRAIAARRPPAPQQKLTDAEIDDLLSAAGEEKNEPPLHRDTPEGASEIDDDVIAEWDSDDMVIDDIGGQGEEDYEENPL